MATTLKSYCRKYLRDPVLLQADFFCSYCGADLLETVDSFVTITRDHLIPRHAGGPDGSSNRVAACSACDRLKGGTHFADLDNARRMIDERRQRRLITLNYVRAAVRQGGDRGVFYGGFLSGLTSCGS